MQVTISHALQEERSVECESLEHHALMPVAEMKAKGGS